MFSFRCSIEYQDISITRFCQIGRRSSGTMRWCAASCSSSSCWPSPGSGSSSGRPRAGPPRSPRRPPSAASGPPAPSRARARLRPACLHLRRRTGWECGGVGPLCLHRSLPKQLRLVVSWRGRQLTPSATKTSALDRARSRPSASAVGPAGRTPDLAAQQIRHRGIRRDERDTLPDLVQPARLRVGASWRVRTGARCSPEARLSRSASTAPLAAAARCSSRPRRAAARSTAPRRCASCTRRRSAWTWRSVERRISGDFTYRLSVVERLQRTAPAR